MILCIRRPETDPYFNIAAEEYVLKNIPTDTFMVWRNSPSIIIGKHQIASREINHEAVIKREIPVVRRISGGGTVYHDPGNINYSFTFHGRKENPIDFVEFTRPVIRFLKTVGLEAYFEEKNNIFLGGKKVSGNSAHLYRGTVLFHGTLLFSSDLGVLNKTITGNEKGYLDRSVRSVRKEVVNLGPLLSPSLSIEEFIDAFYRFVAINMGPVTYQGFSEEQKREITALAESKYSTWQWNYGYSPAYTFRSSFESGRGTTEIELNVLGGIIKKAVIRRESNGRNETVFIERFLTGCPHDKIRILEKAGKAQFEPSEAALLNQVINYMF